MNTANSKDKVCSHSEIEFVKMHGIANDYVYVYDTGNNLPENLSRLSVAVSHRHCGVGGDGLVVISRSAMKSVEFRMRIFNADGSEAQMCGNASRCVGKYLYEKGFTDKSTIHLETLAGVKVLYLDIDEDNNKVKSVRVDMGVPEFSPEFIPVLDTLPTSDAKMRMACVDVDDERFCLNVVSMGNPHAVCFTDSDPTDEQVLGAGPQIERHPCWPERTNVEFARILDRHLIRMRVWERGSGETMACGTGACATAVAAMSLGLADSPVTVRLTGGDLTIEWDRPSGHVFMSGGATTVAEGIYHYESERDNIWMHPRQQ